MRAAGSGPAGGCDFCCGAGFAAGTEGAAGAAGTTLSDGENSGTGSGTESGVPSATDGAEGIDCDALSIWGERVRDRVIETRTERTIIAMAQKRRGARSFRVSFLALRRGFLLLPIFLGADFLIVRFPGIFLFTEQKIPGKAS
ncbi:hypothetical protein AGMMS50268_08980 [Spirochaetia bacterium]|nr:hypothetical protein AGMMS50268_08980 [Spirochaetia bacterium]